MRNKLASLVLGGALLTMGASSCFFPEDPYDPWEPRDPKDSTECPRDSSGNGGEETQWVQGTGTVTEMVEGSGQWSIIASDGHLYELTHLPEEFRKEGLQVSFVGKIVRKNDFSTTIALENIYAV
jgi:hypothetical protein